MDTIAHTSSATAAGVTRSAVERADQRPAEPHRRRWPVVVATGVAAASLVATVAAGHVHLPLVSGGGGAAPAVQEHRGGDPLVVAPDADAAARLAAIGALRATDPFAETRERLAAIGARASHGPVGDLPRVGRGRGPVPR